MQEILDMLVGDEETFVLGLQLLKQQGNISARGLDYIRRLLFEQDTITNNMYSRFNSVANLCTPETIKEYQIKYLGLNIIENER